MMPDHADSDEWVEAAELSLGLLEGDARHAAVGRVLDDAPFATDVASWQERVAAFAFDGTRAAAPAATFARIEAALEDPPRSTRAKRWPWV